MGSAPGVSSERAALSITPETGGCWAPTGPGELGQAPRVAAA